MKKLFIPKEISWLSFNERVLQEADNPGVPLMERIKFLGIYSSNLDQFFEIRVATLKRLSQLSTEEIRVTDVSPGKILVKIDKMVKDQRIVFDKVYGEILDELRKQNIYIVDERHITPEQASFIHHYFKNRVQSRIFPIRTRKKQAFPVLKDKSIYLAVRMEKTANTIEHYSIIEIPTDTLSRFVALPSPGGTQSIIFLDDIIRFELGEIFSVFGYDRFDAYELKVNRDAELDIADDIKQSYIEKIGKGLKKRKSGNPVRFTHDAEMPAEMRDFLLSKLNIKDGDAVIAGGRYHNTSDFMKFPILLKKETAPLLEPIPHPDFFPRKSIFSILSEKSVLLHFPYHSFDNIIDLLREAAIDARVTSIKMTVYRLARNSSVINALINARRNNKKVTVILELQARFDEEANISWANKLEEEGIRVIIGVRGLKVHAKLCLISREESGETQRKQRLYAIVGTGNFNEYTARSYIDTYFLTSDENIVNEVKAAFLFFEHNYQLGKFRHLIISPFSMRTAFYRLIDGEIKNAKMGEAAAIDIKTNNLSDYGIIKRLYKASNAGVKIRIIGRSMFSLLIGVKSMSENIDAISIVDRFLEHNRFYIFANGGDPKCYISSADWMTRNFDTRVEVACPIYDGKLRQEIRDLFEISWADNVKARVLNEKLDNRLRESKDKENDASQIKIARYLQDKTVGSAERRP